MKGPGLLQVRVLSEERMAHLGSCGSGFPGQPGRLKPAVNGAAERRPANPRAETRVNPEDAPKDCCGRRSVLNAEKAATPEPGRSYRYRPSRLRVARRGTGISTWRKRLGQHGRPTGAAARQRPPPRRRAPVGIGGAHSTDEARETGWREGALVPGANDEGEGQGDWRKPR
jgi:hypothetical protein